MADELPSKRAAVERVLSSGPALLRFDPRRPGVDVPADLRGGPVLALRISWNYAAPLSLDDDAVRQSLTFASGPYPCVVPWAALFAVGPDDAMPSWVWPRAFPTDIPQPEPQTGPAAAIALAAEELAAEAVAAEALAAETSAAPSPGPGAQPRPQLLLQPEALPPTDEPPDGDPPGSGRRGHLRLVKG